MWLTRQLDALYDATLALVYPMRCAACGAASVEGRRDAPACAACWHGTTIFTGEETCCWKCGAEARGDVSPEKRIEVRCRRCDEWAFTAARAVGKYEGALRAAVLALKHEPHVPARLAELLCAAQGRPPLDEATRIVPVPLHAERERERGFNQATLLARSLAARIKLPLDEWSVVRRGHTSRHRAGMDRQARRETVERAFQVTRPRLVAGERVLLVDDVFTTGATVSACAQALKEAGALEVFVLTVARA
ncbi:MAG TPA: ComF family protein [Pyrinomonadaceae bacterium]|jgi:ComF family protein|nr:ComF family protein [Pyrinomonadaceae bacterium]